LPSPERTWLIEEGIAEKRALLVEGEQVLAAKVMWPGEITAGTRCAGKLTAKLKGTRRGVALLDGGTEALVDHLPPAVTEGQRLDLVITRAPLAERGRLKRAQARMTGGPSTAFPLACGKRCGTQPPAPASISPAAKSSLASPPR
jgi:hypothetical protein